MSEETKANENIIFFLQLDHTLPKWFYSLALYLNGHQIKLIPVNKDQLAEVNKNSKGNFLIVMETSFSHRKILNSYLKGYLGFAIKQQQLICYHISSFEMRDLGTYTKSNSYKHFKLPCSIGEIAKELMEHYDKINHSDDKWPGGRRARLSDEIVGPH